MSDLTLLPRPPGPRAGDASGLVLAVGLTIFLVALVDAAVAYVPSTWIQRDGRFYTNVNATLVEDASVDQSAWAASWYERDLGWNRNLDAAWSNVSRGREGQRVPKHPILMPVLSTPLFWAFGLPGLLLFNLLAFGAAGAGAFAFARRYASPGAAAFAAATFLLATGIRTHVYDYHVDILLLALWLGGLAALHARRGFLAGVLVAGAVMLKPTTLLLAPAAALLARPDRRTFGRAIAGGSLALGGWALKNWWVFGRPWWAGYNRMLVVENGRTVIASVDAFSVPLSDGLRALWSGPYGLRHRMPLALGGLVGMTLLLRRRPVAVFAVFATAAGAGILFATYLWYGDRFLWPALALALPGLALLVDAFAAWARRERDAVRAVVAVALLGAVGLVAHHRPLVSEPAAWAGVALLAALAGALTLAARRTTATAGSLLAPLLCVLFPGVLERALDPGADLAFALCTVAALASRRRGASLAFALGAALVLVVGADRGAAIADLDWTTGGPRGAAVLLGAALLAAPFLGRHAALALPLLLLGWAPVRGLGAPLPLFAIAVAALLLAAPLHRLADGVVDRWRSARPPGRLTTIAAPFLLLLAVGLTPRVSAEPFRVASRSAVRAADVKLAHVPCDFLAWEHFNWECATYDRGVHGEVGLSTSAPLQVDGREVQMLLVSAPGGRQRRVSWEALEVPAGASELVLEWAVPDSARGGGTLEIWVAGQRARAVNLPTRPDGQVQTHRFAVDPTALLDWELRLEARGSSVLVDGWFE